MPLNIHLPRTNNTWNKQKMIQIYKWVPKGLHITKPNESLHFSIIESFNTRAKSSCPEPKSHGPKILRKAVIKASQSWANLVIRCAMASAPHDNGKTTNALHSKSLISLWTKYPQWWLSESSCIFCFLLLNLSMTLAFLTDHFLLSSNFSSRQEEEKLVLLG